MCQRFAQYCVFYINMVWLVYQTAQCCLILLLCNLVIFFIMNFCFIDFSLNNPIVYKTVLIVGIFLFLSIGRWITLMSWNMWTKRDNNQYLAFFLFPYIFAASDGLEWDKDKGMFINRLVNSTDFHPPTLITWFQKNYRRKFIYFILMVFLGGVVLKVILNLFCVILSAIIELLFRLCKSSSTFFCPNDWIEK